MSKKLTDDQRGLMSQILQFTLTGTGDAEQINRLCGRLVELLPPEDRREVERSIVVHRANLMIERLQGMGYVA